MRCFTLSYGVRPGIQANLLSISPLAGTVSVAPEMPLTSDRTEPAIESASVVVYASGKIRLVAELVETPKRALVLFSACVIPLGEGFTAAYTYEVPEHSLLAGAQGPDGPIQLAIMNEGDLFVERANGRLTGWLIYFDGEKVCKLLSNASADIHSTPGDKITAIY